METTKEPNQKQQARSIEYKLGVRIAYLRSKRELTQEGFAKLAKLSQSTIAQIESGKKDPSVETLIMIADALKVHPAILFAGNDVHVLDMKRMKEKYKKVDDLNDTLYRALGEVTRFARDIGFST